MLCSHHLEINSFVFEFVLCKWGLMGQRSMREGRDSELQLTTGLISCCLLIFPTGLSASSDKSTHSQLSTLGIFPPSPSQLAACTPPLRAKTTRSECPILLSPLSSSLKRPGSRGGEGTSRGWSEGWTRQCTSLPQDNSGQFKVGLSTTPNASTRHIPSQRVQNTGGCSLP